MTDQDWLWPAFKTWLFEDLEMLHKQTGDWDLVIFSGDLVQKGVAKEFERLESILDEIWGVFSKLGFSPKLFVLPGNHDLERPAMSSTIRTLKRWWDEPDVQVEFFQSPDNEYRLAVDNMFASYNAWLDRIDGKKFGFEKGTLGLLPGDNSFVFEKDGLRVGVVGLNSTWLQLDNQNYEGILHVDTKQILGVTSQDPDLWCSRNDLNLLVTHQPPEWLHGDSKVFWDNDINPPGRFSAHLFGHVHESSAKVGAQGGADARIELQGISTFGLATIDGKKDRKHGYSVVRYVHDLNDVLHIWPRRYYKRASSANGLGADNEAFKLENDNSFSIALKPSGRAAQISASTNSLTEIPHEGTIREALAEAEYPLRYSPAHSRVRSVEQKQFLDAITKERACWLAAEWGMGEDGFVSSVKSQTGAANAPTYRLDLSEFLDRRQFAESIKLQINVTFERFLLLVDQVGECWLLLDNLLQTLPGEHSYAAWRREIEAFADTILEFCPKLTLVLRSRRIPMGVRLPVVQITALDEADVRHYVSDHELGSSALGDASPASLLHRHTDGFPGMLERALSELQVVSLSELVSSDLEFSDVVQSNDAPYALVSTIDQLAKNEDPLIQREYSLLKVLSIFPQGETLGRIKRFFNTFQFFPDNVKSLRSRGLVESVAVGGLDIARPDSTEKRLKVSLPVRECAWNYFRAQEPYELNRRAAEIYFGPNWSSGIFKPPPAYRFDRPQCAISDIYNANTIIQRLLKEAVENDDSHLIERVLGLAHSYLRALDRGDHFRSAAAFCRDLIPLIPMDGFEEKSVLISAEYATALRMSGDRRGARDIIEEIRDYPFSKVMKQSLLIDLAFLHEKLGEQEEARSVAREIMELEPQSNASLQAQSLLVEMDRKDPERLEKLALIEQQARRRGTASVIANNIALIRARAALDNPAAAREMLAPIMNSRNKKDFYNRLRASIELAEMSLRDGQKLSQTEENYLVGAYHFVFNERLPGLFDRYHGALWRIFEDRKDYRSLFVLFRYSSLYWRLGDRENVEATYLQKLSVIVATYILGELAEYGSETSYYLIRSASAGDPVKD